MKINKSVIILSCLFSIGAKAKVRSEIGRFTLMSDRITIDRELVKDKYNSFFDLDIFFSSGLKKLIGDVDSSTASASTDAEKIVLINQTLQKTANTERMADIDITTAAPLPYIKIKGIKFLSSFFYNLNIGGSISNYNQTSDASNQIQSYLKKDNKIGINTQVKTRDKQTEYNARIYKISRSDIYLNLATNDIVTKKGLFDLNDLALEDSRFMADFKITKSLKNYDYMLEFQELSIIPKKSKESNLFGNRPLLHGRFLKNFKAGNIDLRSFIGYHYRNRYNIMEGFYIGTHLNPNNHLPFKYTFSLSNQFITINPRANFKYVNLSYTLKMPFRNPQESIWVSSMHGINLNFPFP